MKIKTTRIVCPHCNTTIPGTEFDYEYGSPLRTCPKCKKQYIDRRYHEIAVEGIRQQDINPTVENTKDNKKMGLIFILAGIAAMILFIIIAAASGWAFYVLPVASVGLIISGISTLKNNSKKGIEKTRKKIEAEKIQSEQRMTNPAYVAQLRAAGYTIPEKYNTPAQN